MGRYRNKPRSDSNNNGLLMRLLGYALTTFVIPFILNMIRKKLGDQQRLLCNKCHGKLQVIDKEGNLYCKNCKMIKIDRKS
jgi:late competence protein required for DNA uptake (superfamily II DNA/RNA helicase)